MVRNFVDYRQSEDKEFNRRAKNNLYIAFITGIACLIIIFDNLQVW
jgi:hypothetical protein